MGVKNMKESNLRFSNPIIKKLDYKVNANNKQEDKYSISNSFSINVNKNSKQNEAFVELNICIGDESKLEPFTITMSILAKFVWDDVYDEKTVNDLLTINAPSLLLGYARPIIATITNMSPYPTYNIPFYNFMENP